jgi:hypothetical protein
MLTTASVRSKASDQTLVRRSPVTPAKSRMNAPVGNQAHLRRLATGGQPLQAKLTVGAVDDPLEQEADTAADRVMRMADAPVALSAAPSLSRKAAGLEEGEQDVERAADGTGRMGTVAPPIVDAVLGSPGHALDPATQGFMGERFGADFSDVRVHTDNQSARSAATIDARAYTVGRDIVFGAGEYQPSSQTGRHLLAHELAHVQQQSATVRRLVRTPYPWEGVVTTSAGANLRSSPTIDPANLLGSIIKGGRVTVTGLRGGTWLEVSTTYFGGGARTGFIQESLIDDAASASMEAAVGTTMVWKPSGPHSGTNFQVWASAAAEAPFTVTATTVMNCWEAVLLSAYRAKLIAWKWIHDMYTAIPQANWVATMSRGPRTTYKIPGPSKMPLRGDLVFFDGLGHVALATGNGSQVYTFWPPPGKPSVSGTADAVKVETIEALVGYMDRAWPPAGSHVVEFGQPAW